MHPSLRKFVLLACASCLVPWLAGCSDSTEPSTEDSTQTATQGEGSFDASAGTFVLKTLDVPPPDGGPAVPIQLIGENLYVSPDSGLVSLDVSVQNLSTEPLYAPPALIWLHDFSPEAVAPINADFVVSPVAVVDDGNGNSPIWPVDYGYDYADQLGEDGVLGPGETSAAKSWRFNNPDGVSFSFASQAEFGMVPDLPRIAGFCWLDDNRNGMREPHESLLSFGMVSITLPDGGVATVWLDESGHYAVPIQAAGLYRVYFDPMIDSAGYIVPIGFSTPNPLEVLITPGPDGQPQSFLDANFGVFADLPVQPVIQFADVPPDSLQIADYQLINARLETPWALWADVAFSGCSPEETFSLFMSGGFMESNPVQADLVLRKDVPTDCDAAWENEIHFDLGPLVERFLASYGPGELLLNLHTYGGDVQTLVLEIPPSDDDS